MVTLQHETKQFLQNGLFALALTGAMAGTFYGSRLIRHPPSLPAAHRAYELEGQLNSCLFKKSLTPELSDRILAEKLEYASLIQQPAVAEEMGEYRKRCNTAEWTMALSITALWLGVFPLYLYRMMRKEAEYWRNDKLEAKRERSK